MASLVQGRIFGAFLGAFCGDALGFPLEGLHPDFAAGLSRENIFAFRPHRSGLWPAGQTSYLSQLLLASLRAVSEGSGQTEDLASYFFPLARDRLLVLPPKGLSENIERWVRKEKQTLPVGSGLPVFLFPLILASPGEADLWPQLRAGAQLTGQDDGPTLALTAGFFGALRYALEAEEIVLGDLLDQARQGASFFDRRQAQVLRKIPDLLGKVERDDAVPATEAGRNPAEGALISGLVAFLKSPYDFPRSMLIACRSGAGSLAPFICGALAGAFGGREKIPRELIEKVKDADEFERSVYQLLRAKGRG